MRFLIFLTLIALCGAEDRFSFDGYKVFRLYPSTPEHLKLLLELENGVNELDFWSETNPIGDPVDVMVKPEEQKYFISLTNSVGIPTEVFIDNVQERIDNENVASDPTGEMTWTSYHRIESIHAWLDNLPEKYPGTVEIISAGASFEGRDIKGVKISFRPGRRAVFIEGGIHAREWISPATVTYLINELLTSEDPSFRRIANAFDWYIFPSTNPDGYEYSHDTYRLWRKTRTPYGLCSGADPNRNWDFKWGTEGTSTLTCSDTYGGPNPFSEAETSSLRDFITPIGSNLDVYLSFHSFGQYLLIPYGHTVEHLDNYADLLTIGLKTGEALSERFGTQYRIGNTAEILYKVSGSSTDWVKDTFNVPIAYTYELRDSGRFGFLLPSSQILPNCLEVMDSLVGMFEESENLGYFSLD